MSEFRKIKITDLEYQEARRLMRQDVGHQRRLYAARFEMTEDELRKKINKVEEEIEEIESRGFLADAESERLGELYLRLDKLHSKLAELEPEEEKEWSPDNETKYGGPKDIGAADWWQNGGKPPWEQDE